MNADRVAGIVGTFPQRVIGEGAFQLWQPGARLRNISGRSILEQREAFVGSIGFGRAQVELGGATKNLEPRIESLGNDLRSIIVVGDEGIGSIDNNDRER